MTGLWVGIVDGQFRVMHQRHCVTAVEALHVSVYEPSTYGSDQTYGQLMSHSVRHHLRLEIDAYDETIRTFIPGYEEGLARAANEIVVFAQPWCLTSARERAPWLKRCWTMNASVPLKPSTSIRRCWPRRGLRLKRFGSRARVRRRSFEAPLPTCDAVATALALHHVPTMARKLTLYTRIYRALRPGGVFVNADVAISAHPVAREQSYRRWATHLVSCGIDEQRAYEPLRRVVGGGHLLSSRRRTRGHARS